MKIFFATTDTPALRADFTPGPFWGLNIFIGRLVIICLARRAVQ